MNKIFIVLFAILFSCSLYGQDAYHNALQEQLQTEFGLPTGEWLLYDTEDGNLNNAGSYGCTKSTRTIQDQPFSKYTRINVSRVGNNAWDSGWSIPNRKTIAKDDVILVVFNIRSEGSSGLVNFLVENNDNFEKEIYLGLPTSINWRRYFIPLKVTKAFNLNKLSFGFHLAAQIQQVEVGGFTAINYKKQVSIDDLPSEVNNEFYGGFEPDAPWRAAAAARIDRFRKANLALKVQAADGTPIENAAIDVKMIRHNFDFGTAVTASRINGNNNHNVIYENKIINLDGKGNGFNTVVFENDFKWPAWEDEWFVNKRELVNAVEWLRGNNLKIRGHTLVWPGNNNLPGYIEDNLGDTDFVKKETFDHIEEILNYPGLKGEVYEWDVINEVVTNRSYETAFRGKAGYPTGREIYGEIFEKAREEDSEIGLYLNDYVTMSQNTSPGSPPYDNFKKYLGEIVDSGAPITGVGFQGHIGGFPNDINKVLATLDDFYSTYGLKAKITEFDLPPYVSEQLAANYLRDFLTAIYSHPSTNGFVFWNFWDGASWQNTGCNFYREDWSPKPAKDVFVDLVFKEWWVDETAMTASNGRVNVNGFKGTYEITYTCDGVLVRDTVNLTDPMLYEITCDNISSSVKNINRTDIKIYPNPSQGSIQIEREDNAPARMNIYDISGKKIKEKVLSGSQSRVEVSRNKGIFLLEILDEKGRFTEKITVH